MHLGGVGTLVSGPSPRWVLPACRVWSKTKALRRGLRPSYFVFVRPGTGRGAETVFYPTPHPPKVYLKWGMTDTGKRETGSRYFTPHGRSVLVDLSFILLYPLVGIDLVSHGSHSEFCQKNGAH